MVDWSLLQSNWPHLQGLELEKVRPEEVTIPIGQEEPHEFTQVRRVAKLNVAPFAKLTRFGWT